MGKCWCRPHGLRIAEYGKSGRRPCSDSVEQCLASGKTNTHCSCLLETGLGHCPLLRESVHSDRPRNIEYASFPLQNSNCLCTNGIVVGRSSIMAKAPIFSSDLNENSLGKHGISWAIIIDRPILDLLKINPESDIELTTDGQSIRIAPAALASAKSKVRAANAKVNAKHSNAFRTSPRPLSPQKGLLLFLPFLGRFVLGR